MRKSFVLLPVVAAVLLAGCTMAPKYERPMAPVENVWPQSEATKNVEVLTAGLQEWGDFFTDSRLTQLIDLALKNNRNLRAAMLAVEEARAQYNISRLDLLPSVRATADRTQARTRNAQTGTLSTGWSDYQASAMASFELDLFGRIRSMNEKALQAYFQTEAAQRTAQMTLIAEIAQTWLSLGASKDLLSLAERTHESRKKSAALIKNSFELGASSQIDVQQARTAVASAEIARISAVRDVAQYQNALRLLVGVNYDKNLEPSGLKMDITKPISAISNVPSEVLLMRPDIMAAEAQLKSANANIGVARANFFPTISITGSMGVASHSLSDLFSRAATWNYTPAVSWPLSAIFGTNWQTLKASKVAKEAAIAKYEYAIQSAFREVADALAVEGTIKEQLKASTDLANSTRRTYELAQQRYKNGIDSYLQVLDSQREEFSAQQSLINAQRSRVASLVTLYKVMGGGSQLPIDKIQEISVAEQQAQAALTQTEAKGQ